MATVRPDAPLPASPWRRSPSIVLAAWALGACHDYDLSKPTDGTTPAPLEDSASVPTDEDCALALPEAEALGTPLTCEPVDASWELTVEAAFPAESDVFPAPVVAPVEAGASASIIAGERDYGLVAFDPKTGARTELAAIVSDNEPFAWGLAGGVSIAAVAHLGGVSVAVEGGPFELTAMDEAAAPVLADVDQDGDAEVLFGAGAVGLEDATDRWPTRTRTLATMPVDVDGDGTVEIVAGSGVYRVDGERIVAWPSDFGRSPVGFAQVFPVDSAAIRYLAVDGLGPVGLDAHGELVWQGTDRVRGEGAERWGGFAAVGDTDGDGEPDLCALVEDRVAVVSADGRTLLDDPTGEPLAWVEGGCALADLDADGNHEVVAYGGYGVRLYDVETATLLAEWTDGCSTSWRSAPSIADVDDDGSAEIVVVGSETPCPAYPDHVYVLGPAYGRWARTRPVWNQGPYDPYLVADDGSLARFPRPNPGIYRAQPARDGARPDLAPEVLDACASDCADGEVALSVRVRNTGSVAAEGATVVLSAVEDGALVAIATVSFEEEIPSGWASAAKEIRVPASAWGGHHVLDVVGVADECDVFDDRQERVPDPCE